MRNLQSYIQKHPPNNGMFYMVAIDGRGGSGKTSLSKHVAKLLPKFAVLNGDDYFEPAHDTVAWGCFNEERFAKDVVVPLQKGPSFTYKPYNWHTKPHISKKQMTIQSGIIIERCFSFGLDLNWDLKIWVETPQKVCFDRGVARNHMAEKKEYKAWQIWQEAEDNYISEINPKKIADIVIDGTKPFSTQVG